MMPSTFAEFAVVAAIIWGLYRLLDPLRRRAERWILQWLDPSRPDIVDAEILPNDPKTAKKE